MRLALTATFVVSLALVGCAETGSLGSAAGATPTTLADKVKAVQASARSLCRFEPKAAFVEKVIGIAEPQLAPGIDVVSYIGRGICDAVRTSYAALRAGGPFGHGSLYGVPVAGEILRRGR